MPRARMVQAAIVVVILLVGGGAAALASMGNGTSDSAFHGSAVPALFSERQIASVDAPLRAAEARGHRLAGQWLDRHPGATDAEFSAWALAAIGPPPGRATTAREIAELKTLSRHRDAQGINAANW